MVFISPHRFLPRNQKLGSESAHQKELIGTIFMSCALNLSWNNLFQNIFFENTLFGCFKLKYTFYKNCHFWLSSTVHALTCAAPTTYQPIIVIRHLLEAGLSGESLRTKWTQPKFAGPVSGYRLCCVEYLLPPLIDSLHMTVKKGLPWFSNSGALMLDRGAVVLEAKDLGRLMAIQRGLEPDNQKESIGSIRH
jgi:hypothetical protein